MKPSVDGDLTVLIAENGQGKTAILDAIGIAFDCSWTGTPRANLFHGMADIPAATAKMRLLQLAEEIISILASDPNAEVKITVGMSAEFPDGVTDQVKRAVSENARSLNLKNADWA